MHGPLRSHGGYPSECLFHMGASWALNQLTLTDGFGAFELVMHIFDDSIPGCCIIHITVLQKFNIK